MTPKQLSPLLQPDARVCSACGETFPSQVRTRYCTELCQSQALLAVCEEVRREARALRQAHRPPRPEPCVPPQFLDDLGLVPGTMAYQLGAAI